MLCLHGKPAAKSRKGDFWFCSEPSSCFDCPEEQAFLYDKTIKEFLATKQERPRCCGVAPEASAERNYARIRVVRDITKTNFGRPFFTCSKENDKCDYFEWGDEIIITKPLCKHGKPSKLQKVKKEGPNEGRNFLCCPEPREKSCKFFRWLETPSPREPDEDPADEDPLEPGCFRRFINPPSYTYTVKKTGVMFTSAEADRKKAYDEFLRGNEDRVQERKPDVGTPSGKRKPLVEYNTNKKRK